MNMFNKIPLSVKVAGTSFRTTEIQKVLQLCEGNVRDLLIEFKAEIDNPYDKNAVAVILNGIPCGYIPKQINEDFWTDYSANKLREFSVDYIYRPPNVDNASYGIKIDFFAIDGE